MLPRNSVAGILALTILLGHAHVAAAQEPTPPGRVEAWQHILGPPVAFYIGFGSGQAVQGRWQEMGSTIAVFELGGVAGAILGLLPCLGSAGKSKAEQNLACAPMAVGAVTFFGARLYSVYDTIVTPFEINAYLDHRQRRKRRKRSSYLPEVSPLALRTDDRTSPAMLLTWRW